MSQLLVIVAIGPVQGFIASARRMRDLWYGSDLLSRLATEAEQVIGEHNGDVIIPGSKASHTTNKIVAVVANGSRAPDTLEHDLSKRLAAFLEREGERCRREMNGAAAAPHLAGRRRETGADDTLPTWVDWDRFFEQLRDLLEVTLVAEPFADDNDYQRAYRHAERALAARKATRMFRQSTLDDQDPRGFGVRKSSLDSAREGVLLHSAFDNSTASVRMRRRFGIDANEQLDAPGLLKRVLGREQQFSALTSLVAAPWLAWAAGIDGEKTARVLDSYEALVERGLATRSKHSTCPYDGELLLVDRASIAASAAIEAGDDQRALADFAAELGNLGTSIASRGSLAEWTAPQPYIALIQLDGDHLGAALWQGDRQTHARIAETLQTFATQVHTSCAKRDNAQVIYVGGDDALVACSLETAIPLCRALHDHFAAQVTGQLDGVTLSVGVAIGHVLTPMAQLRRTASEALAFAKSGPAGTRLARQRDAMAVTLLPRSGGATRVRGQWLGSDVGSTLGGLDQRLLHWQARFLQGEYPDALANLMTAALEQYGTQSELLPAVLRRTLERREIAPAHRQKLIDEIAARARAAHATEVANGLAGEWHIARWLARHSYPAFAGTPTSYGGTQ